MSVPTLCHWLYAGDTQEAQGKRPRCLPEQGCICSWKHMSAPTFVALGWQDK